MDYNFQEIESKWRKHWFEHKTFTAFNGSSKPKFYVLDMFPYPSGAGLHVGHPLGYIASDIFARYRRLKGFNVLHPMGYDSFGLPAEQYAIQTGQHPAHTTKENIARYRDQLDQLGFSFDWDREVRTSSPEYYKWTQLIFIKLFDSWYNQYSDQAEPIQTLIEHFERSGNLKIKAYTEYNEHFTAEEWMQKDEKEQEDILQEFRLTYLADSWVNWCPALGTVLANDEVINGKSERGGHPVVQKKMRQWSMRIKAYSERLLDGLEKLDWTDSIKDQQRNWIGKSLGSSVVFEVENSDKKIEVFTTRPDTIFGVSFMVLAPEHPFVNGESEITTEEFKEKVKDYQKNAALKSERDRQSEVKNISGQFTGAYAIHPFSGKKIPVWIGDYVLASYGTGAVMAVPCGDQRDYDFAKHFNLPIPNIFKDIDISEKAYDEKSGIIANSDFLNDLSVKEANKKTIEEIEKKNIGKGKTNYRLRDAVFSRQRYWGEPFPVYYKNGIPKMIAKEYLPIILPEVEKYLPTEDGDPPLGNAQIWAWDAKQNAIVDIEQIDNETVFPLELNTMPGWAGSSFYFARYTDPNNEEEIAGEDALNYWGNVDLYIGGSEHATGHLLYARFWTKFLKDRGVLTYDEPFQKMINQGMILGRSSMILRLTIIINCSDDPDFKETVSNYYLSKNLFYRLVKEKDRISQLILENLKIEYPQLKSFDIMCIDSRHIDISLVNNDNLNVAELKNKLAEFKSAIFILEEDGTFICDNEVEKMSKSKFNVQTPDDLVKKYGADTLRMYEMFLGPLEQSKPWDTKGISGVHNFLKKLWRLIHDENNNFSVSDEKPTKEALKSLHKTIKKLQDDLERFSFNTGVSAFMICVNELQDLKCNNREIIEPLIVLLSSYAPHFSEEIWEKLGHDAGTISYTTFPEFDEKYLVEDNHDYPVSFNGKMRMKVSLPLGLNAEEIQQKVLEMEETKKWLEGQTPKKVIVVPGKIINFVL